VLREVAILAAIGISIGPPGGYGLGKVIESQLFNLKARHPLTFLVATLTLVTTALPPASSPPRAPPASTR
jgi:hypothetical protein